MRALAQSRVARLSTRSGGTVAALPAGGRSPVREMAASVGGATSNAAANLMAAANRGLCLDIVKQ